ncbi:hypothetical protein M011DRAFT_479144 [Sporormia fimetaria CBS 119925]|uniref:Homeobox domain-containing protein n=1 Tax=Sporormia fimetaria CBS 119925 TaxID=1340428 RepID=A0A6A6V7M2_9PLEO|nr:hypothetical protein M011DRAFT_479144 [Sporormia fimetaria CBS 119925]
MLPPNDFPKRANFAPSIWSFDSGYGTGDAGGEEIVREPGFYLQAGTSTNSLDARLASVEDLCFGEGVSGSYGKQTNEPEARLEEEREHKSVASSNDFQDAGDDGFVSFLADRDESCQSCHLLTLTNPGENITCDDCRHPDTIEPSRLLRDFSQGDTDISTADQRSRTSNNDGVLSHPNRSRCSACEVAALIDPSSSEFCAGCAPPATDILPAVPPPSSGYKVRRSRAGRNSKLPLAALTRLQSWLDAHVSNPYPTADEKRQLAHDCKITEKQVTTWFTNARARQLSPLETWLSSGSDDDPAQESDVASAAGTPLYATGLSSLTPSTHHRRTASISGSSAFSTSHSRQQASRRGKKKIYRHRSTQQPQLPNPSTESPSVPVTSPPDRDLWQCTFCLLPLVPKSWRRHEETQHRPRAQSAQWICMLHGPRLLLPSRTGISTSACAFCLERNPSHDHFSHHRIPECADKPVEERTFFRPDHLRQHVRNVHGVGLADVVRRRWKKGGDEEGEKKWRCGFCGVWCTGWKEREGHVAGHFRAGLRMESWRQEWADEEDEEEEELEGVKRRETVIKRAMTVVKKEKEKEKGKEKEKESTFKRLSRTLTRRSTRSSHKSTKTVVPEEPAQQRPENLADDANTGFLHARYDSAYSFSSTNTSNTPALSMSYSPAEQPLLQPQSHETYAHNLHPHPHPLQQHPPQEQNPHQHSDPFYPHSAPYHPSQTTQYTTPLPPTISLDPFPSSFHDGMDWPSSTFPSTETPFTYTYPDQEHNSMEYCDLGTTTNTTAHPQTQRYTQTQEFDFGSDPVFVGGQGNGGWMFQGTGCPQMWSGGQSHEEGEREDVHRHQRGWGG